MVFGMRAYYAFFAFGFSVCIGGYLFINWSIALVGLFITYIAKLVIDEERGRKKPYEASQRLPPTSLSASKSPWINYVSVISGLMVLVSIALPWWSAFSGSELMFSISPLRLGELPVTVGGLVIWLGRMSGTTIVWPAAIIVPLTVVVCGAVDLIGVRYRILRVPAILIGAFGFIIFTTAVGATGASWPVGLGLQTRLSENFIIEGVQYSWGLSWGFYLAQLSVLALGTSLVLEWLRIPFHKT